MNTAYWNGLLITHREYLEGLLDGSLGQSDLWKPTMTVQEAIVMERKNIAFCEAKIQEVTND